MYNRSFAQVQAELKAEAFAAAWSAGEALTLEQAVTEALAVLLLEHGHTAA